MNWKINDEAKALFDIYLVDANKMKDPNDTKKIVFMDQKYKVQDVITLKCGQFLNIGIENNKDVEIRLDPCPLCHKRHSFKKSKYKFIFFPHCWFVKPKEDKLHRRMRRKIKRILGKEHEIKKLVQVPIKKTREIPERIHRKKRIRETEKA